tara:strand:+ start:909 stop:1532 length:624 start_codon:yes stop_codon:yes gene_type:complete
LKNRLGIFVWILGILISATACETESSQSLVLNNAFLSLKPAKKYSKRFANDEGDTTSLNLIKNLQEFENFEGSTQLGSFGTTDRIEAEKRTYQLYNSDPEIYFTYRFYLQSTASDDRGYSDILSLELQDSSSVLADQIQFSYRNDSLYLNSANVFYADSLSLISKTFTEVFGPNVQDPSENRMYYFNLSKGLVGFRTQSGKLYELID